MDEVNLKNELNKTQERIDILLVEDALRQKSYERTKIQRDLIKRYFLCHSKISTFIIQSADNVIDKIIELSSLYVIKTLNEPFIIKDEPLTYSYIILRGKCRQHDNIKSLREHDHLNLDEFMLTSDLSSYNEGDILGIKRLFEGHNRWSKSIVNITQDENSTNDMKKSYLYLCKIPSDALLEYIGYTNDQIKESITSFWKYLRIRVYLNDYNPIIPPIHESDFNPLGQNLSLNSSKIELNKDYQSCLQNHDSNGRKKKYKSLLFDDDDDEIDIDDLTVHQYDIETTLPKIISIPLRNGIDSVRCRKYQSGCYVFEQNSSRKYFYLIVKGECALIRKLKIPKKDKENEISTQKNSLVLKKRIENGGKADDAVAGVLEGTEIQPTADSETTVDADNNAKTNYDNYRDTVAQSSTVEASTGAIEIQENKMANQNHNHPTEEKLIDIGIHMLSGDFSFMDGETSSWLHRKIDMTKYDKNVNKKISTKIKSELLNIEKIELKKQKRKNEKNKHLIYGLHRHSMITLTPVEVFVVPIDDLANNASVFLRLLIITSKRYVTTTMSDAWILEKYQKDQLWNAEKNFILNEVFTEKMARKSRLEYEDVNYDQKLDMTRELLTVFDEKCLQSSPGKHWKEHLNQSFERQDHDHHHNDLHDHHIDEHHNDDHENLSLDNDVNLNESSPILNSNSEDKNSSKKDFLVNVKAWVTKYKGVLATDDPHATVDYIPSRTVNIDDDTIPFLKQDDIRSPSLPTNEKPSHYSDSPRHRHHRLNAQTIQDNITYKWNWSKNNIKFQPNVGCRGPNYNQPISLQLKYARYDQPTIQMNIQPITKTSNDHHPPHKTSLGYYDKISGNFIRLKSRLLSKKSGKTVN